MKSAFRWIGSAALAVALLSPAPRGQAAEQGISAAEAARHIGEHETVCGMVASAHYAARSRGQPTYLNLDRPYPNQIFTAVIWGSDRSKVQRGAGYPLQE